MHIGDTPVGCPDRVDALVTEADVWPDDLEFPLTPEECLWLLKGYAVVPREDVRAEQMERLAGSCVMTPEGRLHLLRKTRAS